MEKRQITVGDKIQIFLKYHYVTVA